MGSSIYSSERAGPKKESVALGQGRRDTGLGQGGGGAGQQCPGRRHCPHDFPQLVLAV